MSEDLRDRVCIVTGAASGIGRACAVQLSAAGCRLVLADIDQEGLDRLVTELTQAGREAVAVRVDIASESDTRAMARTALDRFGRIDVLVAAAGILRVGGSLKTLADTPLDEWRTVIDTNLTGTFLCNQAVLPAMLAQKAGDIVNLSSTSGRQGRPFDGPYSASKFGIIGLSESLAEEVAASGVRVQTLLPDAVETPLWDQNGPAALKPPALLPPERVAELVVYLVSLPRDAMLLNPVIAPMKTRKRRGKKGRE